MAVPGSAAMNLDWVAWWQTGWSTWSSPVAIWWCCLTIVSALNIALWFKLVAVWSRSGVRSRCRRTCRRLDRHSCHRASPSARRGLRVRLRFPFGAAARRCAAHLSVRHLALERDGRPLGGDRRRTVLRRAMGHRAARARPDQSFRHHQEHRRRRRAAHRAGRVLLLVRGDLDQFPRQCSGKFDLGCRFCC